MMKTRISRAANQAFLPVASLAIFAACSGGPSASGENVGTMSDNTSALTASSCSIRPTGVVAIGDDGNAASNVIDGDGKTRWSNDGQGSWIRADLGSAKALNGLAISWYKGDSRKSNFTVSVSSDDATYADVFTGTSGGASASLEAYAFNASGRYVKITVNGNSKNNWASITGIRACAADGTPADAGTEPPPPPPPPPPPQDAGTNPPPGGGLTGVDKNGVSYLPIDGYRYVSERFDWTKNFKSNGSMRHDFEGTPDENQAVVGYFIVNGSNDEELSAKLCGGPHTDSKKTWADTYDLGVTNFAGTRARLRFEATHPEYDNGPTNAIHLGDLRNKWVGVMGIKVNVDQDHDGTIDHVRVLAYVDPTGVDELGKPKNGWVNTLDVTLTLDQVKLKSPTVPYVVKIGHPEDAQATLRNDGQSASKYKYQYLAYRALQLN